MFQVQNRAEESSSSLLAPMRGPGPGFDAEHGVGEGAGSPVTIDMYFARSRNRVSVTNTRDSLTPCEG